MKKLQNKTWERTQPRFAATGKIETLKSAIITAATSECTYLGGFFPDVQSDKTLEKSWLDIVNPDLPPKAFQGTWTTSSPPKGDREEEVFG